ncbi:MAG: MarR family transcriptional regulator [Rhodothermales bacterium]|nr:MarR family transcriptional regulator [Rhodothermales bacterium]
MPTHFSGSPEQVLALDTLIKLSRASESVSARVNTHLQAYRLTVSQFGVLEALYHLGDMMPSELAGKILKSGANMTTVLDNLERRSLVARTRRGDDRRCIEVHLTEVGRSLFESIWPAHVERVAAAIGRLDAEEQQRLGALCRKLGRG